MATDTNVLLVEDDFYARHMLELLLRRDWRTRVVGEANAPADVARVLSEIHDDELTVDLILLDTDIPHDPNWLTETLNNLVKHAPHKPILFIGMAPNSRVAKLFTQPYFAGYILKNEIRYSLAWAVSLAAEGHMVTTPGARNLLENVRPLPTGALILDGRNLIAAFSKLNAERARLALIFSMERQEIADELKKDDEYSYGIVSALFDAIGLNDVLLGEVQPEEYFGTHPVVLRHVNHAIEAIKKAEVKALDKSQKADGPKRRGKPAKVKMAKVKEKESLAFHLLTLPEIDPIL